MKLAKKGPFRAPPLFLPTPLYSTVPPPKDQSIRFSQNYRFSCVLNHNKQVPYIKIIKNKYKLIKIIEKYEKVEK